jgi:branched-chain amino acid transport system ATP-binding protein
MKLLELARALMLDPTLMLLDEPTAGVNPVLKEEIVQKLKGLNEMGKTILLIEHDIQTMCKLCEKVAVLVEGEKRVEAAPQDLEKIDLVRKAYFLE